MKLSIESTSFYSTLVRLKERGSICLCVSPKTFLFHIGTIKSKMQGKKTKEDYQESFYSTLVRLKDELIQQAVEKMKSFYSTLVRLKAVGISADQPLLVSFLFHIGTIKSNRHLDQHPLPRSFYSTLVRLKEKPKKSCSAERSTGFYSTLVRLKVIPQGSTTPEA